ncbi:MAG: carboxymuconolactone decarboxylase family protein [Motiliproteus sp.]
MAFIDTIHPHQAEGEVRALYQHQQNHYGYVPNYAKVFCYRPELMELWGKLQAGIRHHIEPRSFELATLSAAHALKNSACSLAHAKALTRFYTEDEVLAIVGGSDTCPLTESEQAMMKFARQVALDAASVSAEDVAGLRHHGYADAEIFDIAITAAARSFFTKVLDALGVSPDSSVTDMNEAFRQTLTVGRSVDQAPLERLRF